jgi:hypothetical protein
MHPSATPLIFMLRFATLHFAQMSGKPCPQTARARYRMPAPVTELSTRIKVAGPAFESRQGRKARESVRPCQRSLWRFRLQRGYSAGPGERRRIETSLADVHVQLAEHSVRFDWIAARLDRIEPRLELVEPADK